jgi:hypothetical protein
VLHRELGGSRYRWYLIDHALALLGAPCKWERDAWRRNCDAVRQYGAQPLECSWFSGRDAGGYFSQPAAASVQSRAQLEIASEKAETGAGKRGTIGTDVRQVFQRSDEGQCHRVNGANGCLKNQLALRAYVEDPR